ncbi:MAG: response regulator [Anaerolineae bacterium]|nr:response regulator [Anaerolineae bacterium]
MMTLILIIVSDDHLREGIRDLLELEGYAVLDTDLSTLGVQLAQEYLPKLVICDAHLDSLDGYWVLYELRDNVRTASIPVVMLVNRQEQAPPPITVLV